MAFSGRFGVIGQPVHHSLSPDIHRQFAAQFGAAIDYQKYPLDAENLARFIRDFFAQGGRGLNVTLPFKTQVLSLVDQLSDEARLAGSVNTLYLDEGKICGTTTDGLGLLNDLNCHRFDIAEKKLLVIGAGGASQAILVSLLKSGAKIKLLNRSQTNAEMLVNRFSAIGAIELYQQNEQFDGIISTISEFNPQLMNLFSHQITAETFCYDLNYAERAAALKEFVIDKGCRRFADGSGMLLGQAAESFRIWTGHTPDIEKVNLTKR